MRYQLLSFSLIMGAAVLIGALVSPYLLGTADVVDVPALVIPAESAPDANAPLLLTALAHLPGSAGHPAIIATAVPTPTSPPLPKRPTETPFPVCPNPGGVCEWVDAPPTPHVKPTNTPYPTCATPVPGDRCRDVDIVTTPEPRCWSAGWGRRVCWPSGCRALSEEWCR